MGRCGAMHCLERLAIRGDRIRAFPQGGMGPLAGREDHNNRHASRYDLFSVHESPASSAWRYPGMRLQRDCIQYAIIWRKGWQVRSRSIASPNDHTWSFPAIGRVLRRGCSRFIGSVMRRSQEILRLDRIAVQTARPKRTTPTPVWRTRRSTARRSEQEGPD